MIPYGECDQFLTVRFARSPFYESRSHLCFSQSFNAKCQHDSRLNRGCNLTAPLARFIDMAGLYDHCPKVWSVDLWWINHTNKGIVKELLHRSLERLYLAGYLLRWDTSGEKTRSTYFIDVHCTIRLQKFWPNTSLCLKQNYPDYPIYVIRATKVN